jgi:PIN domain nuclease of toxin-antitoxin system
MISVMCIFSIIKGKIELTSEHTTLYKGRKRRNNMTTIKIKSQSLKNETRLEMAMIILSHVAIFLIGMLAGVAA